MGPLSGSSDGCDGGPPSDALKTFIALPEQEPIDVMNDGLGRTPPANVLGIIAISGVNCNHCHRKVCFSSDARDLSIYGRIGGFSMNDNALSCRFIEN